MSPAELVSWILTLISNDDGFVVLYRDTVL